MPRSDWAREPQLPSLRVWSLCSATREAAIVRGPRTAMKSGSHLPQLEKALAQKRRPNIAINQSINKKSKRKKKRGGRRDNKSVCRCGGGRGGGSCRKISVLSRPLNHSTQRALIFCSDIPELFPKPTAKLSLSPSLPQQAHNSTICLEGPLFSHCLFSFRVGGWQARGAPAQRPVRRASSTGK